MSGCTCKYIRAQLHLEQNRYLKSLHKLFIYILMASSSLCNGLTDIQSDCLLRLLREANLSPTDDNKSDLDLLVEKGQKAMKDDELIAHTLSDQLWNGQPDGRPSRSKDALPSCGMAAPSSSSTNQELSASSSSTSQPVSFQARGSWNKWVPDCRDQQQVVRRMKKDDKNVREMFRKKRKGLHT